jgi:hypothetical protein
VGKKNQNKKIGKSHDVIENTCRKNVSRAFSHDVDENTDTLTLLPTICMKTKVVISSEACGFWKPVLRLRRLEELASSPPWGG